MKLTKKVLTFALMLIVVVPYFAFRGLLDLLPMLWEDA